VKIENVREPITYIYEFYFIGDRKVLLKILVKNIYGYSLH